ncbi:MAG: BTAD domain-containing putative transcriptional regulator [Gemmatimonadaceae bacterium]
MDAERGETIRRRLGGGRRGSGRRSGIALQFRVVYTRRRPSQSRENPVKGGALLEIHMLGGLSIASDGRTMSGAAARKKPLAVLALLACAGERGMSRDRLISFLWPEATMDDGRSSLRQTLYGLRRDLGEHALFVGTTELRLDGRAVRSDVAAFEDALVRGARNEAVTLYRGPFLDGFHLTEVPEFEEWVAYQRQRFVQLVQGALETLTADAERAGDLRTAISWSRQLANLDPLSTRTALTLTRLLAAYGEPESALQHARVYERRVRGELGTEPDPELTEFTSQLHSLRESRSKPAGNLQVSLHNGADESAAQIVHPAAIASTSTFETIRAPSPAVVGSRNIRRLLVSTFAAVTLGLAGVGIRGFLWRANGDSTAVDPNRLVVFPFVVHASAANSYLATALMQLVSRNLDRAGTLRSLDTRAIVRVFGSDSLVSSDLYRAREASRQLGAGRVVLGDVVDANGHLRVSAAMYEVRGKGNAVAVADVEGDESQIFVLIDRLTGRLLAEASLGPRMSRQDAGSVMTDSLAALKLFLDGERALAKGEFAQAARAFQKSTDIDSTFALGSYRLAFASEWALDYDRARAASATARRHMARLSEHDRELVEAFDDYLNGRLAEAEQRYRHVLSRFPEDVEAWNQLAEVEYHGTSALLRPFEASRAAWEKVLAYEPGHVSALIHLSRISASEHRRDEFDTLAARLSRVAAGSDRALETRVLRDVVFGDDAAVAKLVADLRRQDEATVLLAATTALAYSENFPRQRKLALILADSARAPDSRASGYLYLTYIDAGAGQWTAAKRDLDDLEALRPAEARELRVLIASLPYLRVSSVELAALRDQVRGWGATPLPSSPSAIRWFSTAYPNPTHARLFLIGLTSVRLGDMKAARLAADSLEYFAAASHKTMTWELAHALRAELAAAKGDNAEALEHMKRMRREVPIERLGSGFFAYMPENVLQATLYVRTGQWEQALLAYASLSRPILLAQAALGRAETYERLRKPKLAAQSYARFLELWKDCDPQLRPTLTYARSRLLLSGAKLPVVTASDSSNR